MQGVSVICHSRLFGIPKYVYILEKDYSYTLKYITVLNPLDVDFGSVHQQGNKAILHIKKPYAWDGCSGYVWQGDTIAREGWMPEITPTSGRYTNTLAASLVHDFLYQYINELATAMGISKSEARKLADKEFYEILKMTEFSYAWVYYCGVRIFGRYTHSYMNWIHT